MPKTDLKYDCGCEYSVDSETGTWLHMMCQPHISEVITAFKMEWKKENRDIKYSPRYNLEKEGIQGYGFDIYQIYTKIRYSRSPNEFTLCYPCNCRFSLRKETALCFGSASQKPQSNLPKTAILLASTSGFVKIINNCQQHKI